MFIYIYSFIYLIFSYYFSARSTSFHFLFSLEKYVLVIAALTPSSPLLSSTS